MCHLTSLQISLPTPRLPEKKTDILFTPVPNAQTIANLLLTPNMIFLCVSIFIYLVRSTF